MTFCCSGCFRIRTQLKPMSSRLKPLGENRSPNGRRFRRYGIGVIQSRILLAVTSKDGEYLSIDENIPPSEVQICMWEGGAFQGRNTESSHPRETPGLTCGGGDPSDPAKGGTPRLEKAWIRVGIAWLGEHPGEYLLSTNNHQDILKRICTQSKGIDASRHSYRS